MTTPTQQLSPVKQALLALNRQQERIRQLEEAAREPLAIIGLGCRFPGGANTPEEFWQLLAQGKDAISEVPPDRWDIDAYYHADPDMPGKMNCRQGGFVEQVDGFDAEFFNLSPKELKEMDPQQRLLLEVSWEALEQANQIPGALDGSRTGVFVGISTLDYYARQQATRGAADISAYYVSGNVLSVAAGRIAYLLGLNGPSMSIDTACSSSLTALHLACQNLRARACDLALAGGVGLMLTPEPSIAFTKARMLAPDGQCKTFAAAADGYGRGEGCAMVVLKRLNDALADGDRILALIRGSAVNQNGASGGLTMPSGSAQVALLRAALENAGCHPDEVDYVEAHGTGTALGDPIELRSLAQVFSGKSRGRPLLVGSVKTNIGHLEAAAGIAGVVKVVLALEHGAIPPNLHFTEPTPHFPWEQDTLQVVTELQHWPSPAGRLAGVSAFGFAGSNAHVLIGAPPPSATATVAAPGPQMLALSARTPAALQDLARRYQTYLERHPQAVLAEVCYGAYHYRSRFKQRVALLGDTSSEMINRLRAFLADPAAATIKDDTPAAQAARAFLADSPVDWSLFGPNSGRRPLLPTYPFQRQRYWYDQDTQPPVEETAPVTGRHPLLGRRVATPFLRVLYESSVRQEHAPLLADHRVGGEIVVAGAHYLAMILSALDASGADKGWTIDDLRFSRPLVVRAGTGYSLQLGIADTDPQRAHLRIASHPDQADPGDSWTTHVTATVVAGLHTSEHESLQVLWQRCPVEITPEKLYDHAQASGIWLGPSYRPQRQIHRGDGEALGLLAGPFGAGLLDGCLQLSIAALPDFPRQTLVPTAIARISPHGPPIPSVCWCHVRVLDSAPARILCRLLIMDAEGRLCLSIEGFEARAVDPEVFAGRLETHWREWLYRVAWHPLAAVGTTTLPMPDRLGQKVRAGMACLVDSQAVTAYCRGLAELETLSAAYAREALSGFGVGTQTGWRGKADAPAIAPQHRRLFARLQQIASETDCLDIAPSRQLAEAISAQHGPVSRELRVLQRCGPALADVLRGTCDPLSLLFPDGESDELAVLYADSAAARCMNTLLGETVIQALADWPAGRPVRLLEIGAGTGASTAYLLERLPHEQMEYVFSDISPHFTNQARDRFSPHPCLRFAILDIERDPVRQGFEAHGFDLIVAANVLHATRDLKITLGNVRRLLAGGGLLILLEGIDRQGWLDLIFGLTDGWWRFNDVDIRPDYPLLAVADWRRLLLQCGFEAADAIVPDACLHGLSLHQAVLVGRAAKDRDHDGQHWLIFADEEGCGLALAARLQTLGAECSLVWREGTGSRPASLPSGQYSIRPDDVAGFAALIARLSKGRPLTHIQHLWSLDATSASAEPDEVAAVICQSGLHLVQALVSCGLKTLPALTFATPGRNGSLAGEHMPVHAPLWGLAKVIALEYPDLHCRCIDLGDARGTTAAAHLYQVLDETNEPEISLRKGQYFAPRLQRYQPVASPPAALPAPESTDGTTPFPSQPPTLFSASGSCLVSGAFGGLGLLLTEWLVQQGARHLLLLGRRAPDATSRSRLSRLEAEGVTILVRQVDVCDRHLLAEVITDAERTGPPLKGVFHASGLLDDGLLPDQTWPRLQAAMAPKIQGAWNLHLATAHCSLTHFVLYSSVAALLGSAGQASHAAGNAFLDALAVHRLAAGQPGLSVAWGAWAEIGAAARIQQGDHQILERWRRQGFGTLAPGQAMKALQGLLADAAGGHVAVVPIDWPNLLHQRPHAAFLENFRSIPEATAAPRPAPEPQPLRQRLLASPAAERARQLNEHLRDQVASILGWTGLDSVDSDSHFLELGMDSLTSMELRNRLQTALGCSLPTTLTFDYPNVTRLTAFLLERLADAAVADQPPHAETRPTKTAGAATFAGQDILAGISDEDLDPLLFNLLSEKRS